MKNKNVAAILAFLGGVFGIHRFYLGQVGLGILYLLLFMTSLSLILGILDGIIFLTMDQEVFDAKYNSRYRYNTPGESRRRTRPDFRRPPQRTQRRQQPSNRREAYRSRPVPPRPARAKTARPVSARTPRHNPFKQSGIKKFKDFDFESAIDDFTQALKIAPKDVTIHFNIACAYSQIEQADKAMHHLGEAVNLGFNDFAKIDTHDSLAYVRIQPTWEEFKDNGYTNMKKLGVPQKNLLDDDMLLSQLKKLSELKEKGLITEKEFIEQKQKLMT